MSDLRVAFPNPCRERWESMNPQGCHRTCAKCDKVIHDLSQYDVVGVEKLLRDEPGSCVRARVDAFGVVATKPDPDGGIRRIVAVVGVSASLLMSSPVFSSAIGAKGTIIGTVQTSGFKTKVTVKDKDGRSFETKVRSNGSYKIKNLPSGTYSLEISGCGTWTLDGIVVEQGETLVPDPSKDNECIVVGVLKFGGAQG